MLKVRDIMSRDVLTVTREMSVRDAMELFAARHVSGAPVVAGDTVVGVVSSSDLLLLAGTLPVGPAAEGGAAPEVETEVELRDAEADRAVWGDLPGWEGGMPASYYTEAWTELPPEGVEPPSTVAGPEWSTLEAHTVDEAMSTNIVALPPDADVEDAAERMKRFGIHRVLVMEGTRLVGLVSALDMAKAVAAHRITARQYVFGRGKPRDERENAGDDATP